MHTTHLILSSYHLLVQVPSYATPPREKARDWGAGRWGNRNGRLPLLFSLNSHSPKGGMERVNVWGAVTEMSLYPNCNSVRNTNLQTSDEQWPLEGENKRLTRAVEGLTLKGARAVQDKHFRLPVNCLPWLSLPRLPRELSPSRCTGCGCLSRLPPWSQYSSFRASALYPRSRRLQRAPDIYSEVVLIYLHSWLSNTTKEVNPFRNMKTKDVENK